MARQACGGINALLGHPLEILLVDLGPFEPELGASVAGLDAPDAPRICACSRCHLGAAARAVPPPGALRKQFPLVLAGAHGTRRHLLAGHETQQACEDCANLPRRVEALGVEVADAEAEACGRLEAARGRVHADCGRRERVVGREHEGAPVLAAVVRSVGRAGEDVVPLEDVPLRGVCDDVGRW